MHITPETVRAAYDYLRSTLPFRRWKLPEGDAVTVIINRNDKVRAYCTDDNNSLTLSSRLIQTSEHLIITLAHEMIHMYLNARKVKAAHGRDFQRLAGQVCKQHGFNKDYF